MMNRIPIRSAADVPLLLAWQKYVSRVHIQIIAEAHCQIAASSSILVLHPLTDATAKEWGPAFALPSPILIFGRFTTGD